MTSWPIGSPVVVASGMPAVVVTATALVTLVNASSSVVAEVDAASLYRTVAISVAATEVVVSTTTGIIEAVAAHAILTSALKTTWVSAKENGLK
jgi:hypothetical protein